MQERVPERDGVSNPTFGPEDAFRATHAFQFTAPSSIQFNTADIHAGFRFQCGRHAEETWYRLEHDSEQASVNDPFPPSLVRG